jgi:predicted NodU family carbamoyl transferase
MKKHIYVLGTGLSHNGSACLLKDGDICVAIEKERLSRMKHDGGNDSLAINYCLDAEGITVNDLDLVVQSALQGGNFDHGNDFFNGPRLFTKDLDVPVITISHHLAHAYSTINNCPFKDNFNVLIIDGSGSPFSECSDLYDSMIPDKNKIHNDVQHLYFEKDSYYSYESNKLNTIYKDFSAYGFFYKATPTQTYTVHSIGGLYQAISNYCFRNQMDAGKLMGLSPYGNAGVYKEEIFDLRNGRVFINTEWLRNLTRPAQDYSDFKKNFKYYADIAYHVQHEVQRAIKYVVTSRLELSSSRNLCYAGGVALNAVANHIILTETNVENLYIQPAAGDNGVAIGCAYYGWLKVLGNERNAYNNKSTCFGITYSDSYIEESLHKFENKYHSDNLKIIIDNFFKKIETKYNAPGLRSPDIVIQFDIKNYCTYQIVIKDSGIKSFKNSSFSPTCIIELDEIQLATIIIDPTYFNTLLDLGRIKVSNHQDIVLFNRLININRISKDPGIYFGTQSKKIAGKFSYEPDSCVRKTAQLLAAGKVIAWFQGGSEFGPRALGRRSILADPRTENIRDFINSEIKFREDFRPFAPAVLREDVSIYFKNDRESPYMTLVDYVREEWHPKISSIVHKNNTSRIQTVTPDWNSKFYQLLVEFKKLTGVSLLLNTSLNRKGMTIVETPNEALDFFYSCKLDFLVMGNYIVGK